VGRVTARRGAARRTRTPRRRSRARREARRYVASESTSGRTGPRTHQSSGAGPGPEPGASRRPGAARRSRAHEARRQESQRPKGPPIRSLRPPCGELATLAGGWAFLAERLPPLRAVPTPCGTGATAGPRRLPCGRAALLAEDPAPLARSPAALRRHRGPFITAPSGCVDDRRRAGARQGHLSTRIGSRRGVVHGLSTPAPAAGGPRRVLCYALPS
jgi:hypothetical protein